MLKHDYIVPEDKERVTRAIWLASLALISLLVAIASLSYLFVVMKVWSLNKDTVVCVPLEQEYNLPFVYRQSSLHPVRSDAIIKKFAQEYIGLTRDESIVNYYAVSNNARYSDAMLSSNKYRAMFLSIDMELKKNTDQFYKSSETVQILKANKSGWTFHIDDIIVRTSGFGDEYYIDIHGEYEITMDNAKTDLPHTLYGKKKISLFVVTSAPSEDKGEYINKYGLYVAWSAERNLSPAEYEENSKKTSEDYIMKE
jgi:hypothetical protein